VIGWLDICFNEYLIKWPVSVYLFIYYIFGLFPLGRCWRTMTCAPDRSLPRTWQTNGPHLALWIPMLLHWIRSCTGNAQGLGRSMCLLFLFLINVCSQIIHIPLRYMQLHTTTHLILNSCQFPHGQRMIQEAIALRL